MRLSATGLLGAMAARYADAQVKVGTGVKLGTGIKVSGAASGPAGTPFISAQTLGALRNNFTGCVGFVFTGATPAVTVTALGRWVVAGNSGSHTVYLVQGSGDVVVASAVVDTNGASAGAYKYTAVTPVALVNGSGYILCSAETNAGDQWYDNDSTINTFSSTVALSVDGGAGYTTVPPSAGNSFLAGASPATYGPVNLLF